MRRLTAPQSVRSQRGGFTIVELLMVVGILLFLIATSAFVVRNIGNKAREKATMATIVKVNGLVQDRIEAMRKALDSSKNQRQIESLVGQKYASLVNNFSGKYRGLPRPVVEILVRKDIFRQNFPQYIAENTSINTAMNAQTGVTSGAAGDDLNTGDGGASISSEYLYYVLTKHETYGVPPVGEDSFTTNEVKDTDGDGLMEFVDGWGKPLRFYRWPTRVIRPEAGDIDRDFASVFFAGLPPASAAGFNEQDPLSVDPDDPQSRIEHENDRSGDMLIPLFNTTVDYKTGEYATAGTFWLPLIVSAGEDGVLGLYEPHDETHCGVLAQRIAGATENVFDNITNHNQRAGGR